MGRDEEVTCGEWLVAGLRRRGGYWRVTGLCWVFLLSTVWFLPATRNSLHATASFAGAIIIESATWRRGRRSIGKGFCIRCVGFRRQIGSGSGGLRQDRAWSELRRTSPWTNPENVQNLSSSAARNLPRCFHHGYRSALNLAAEFEIADFFKGIVNGVGQNA